VAQANNIMVYHSLVNVKDFGWVQYTTV